MTRTQNETDLPITTNDDGFWLVHPEWSGRTMKCCDVAGCNNSEPWHRIRYHRGDKIWLCDPHFGCAESQAALPLEVGA